MTQLANCARCNQVFAKTVRDICPDCYREEEQAFQKVYRFLSKRKNREATLQEIVKATKVDEDLIIKFIRTNRLQTSRFPKLSYPCEKCGTPIVTGKLCANCSDSILSEFKQHESLEKRQERLQKERERIDTYYSIEKHKK